jgi:hypothetical protein
MNMPFSQVVRLVLAGLAGLAIAASGILFDYAPDEQRPSAIVVLIVLSLAGVAALIVVLITLLLPEYRVQAWLKWFGVIFAILVLTRIIVSFFSSG